MHRAALPSRPRSHKAWAAVLATALLSAACTAGVAAITTAGQLDRSFGDRGMVLGEWSNISARRLVRQPDGKIVLAGGSTNGGFAGGVLYRFNAGGSLDPTFDGDGSTGSPFYEGTNATAQRYDLRFTGLGLQPDGKLVVAGDAEGHVFLARYRPDGSLDPSFGGDGKVYTFHTDLYGVGSITINDLALQTDGKIVVAGHTVASNMGLTRFILLRYDPDGTLDEDFGEGGIVTTDFTSAARESATAVEIQADGRIVSAGWAEVDGRQRFALTRHRPSGGADTSFSDDGRRLTNFTSSTNEAIYALLIQPDGKLVVAGSADRIAASGDARSRFALARYKTSGSLDTSFDGDGKVIAPGFFLDVSKDVAFGIAIQPDGKLVVAGKSDTGPSPYAGERSTWIAVARYRSDGALDPTFNGSGMIRVRHGETFQAGAGDVIVVPGQMARDRAGRPLVAGSGRMYNGSQLRFLLVRFLGS